MLSVLLFLVVMTLLGGLFVQVAWGWFVVPLGLSPVSWAHAMGISTFVQALTHQHHVKTDKKDVDLGDIWIAGLSRNAVYFGFAWLWHACM